MIKTGSVGILLAFVLFFFPGLIYSAPGDGSASSWNGGVPEDLRRPRRGEAPRYPQDLVIGDLGAGEAPEEAYRFGLDLLSALAVESRDAPALAPVSGKIVDELLEKLRAAGAQRYRIGGGREENDGSISFLVRFLGREQGIAGELFLRFEKERWTFDDLILEEPVDLVREREHYRYDFSPYERFY